MKILKFVTLTILIFAAFQSCKTKQTISKPSKSISTASQIINEIQKAQPTFTTANVAKMNIALKLNERNVNVNAACRIIADSLIHVSVQPMLGIELFKAALSRDSILLFDKMNRRMYALSYDYINQHMGMSINFNTMQSIIAQQFFSLPSSNQKIWQKTLIPSQIFAQQNDVSQATTFNQAFLIDEQTITANNAILQLKYSEREDFMGILFPKSIYLSANKSEQNISITFKISKLTFNQDFNISTMDPTRYRRESIDQLLKK